MRLVRVILLLVVAMNVGDRACAAELTVDVLNIPLQPDSHCDPFIVDEQSLLYCLSRGTDGKPQLTVSEIDLENGRLKNIAEHPQVTSLACVGSGENVRILGVGPTGLSHFDKSERTQLADVSATGLGSHFDWRRSSRGIVIQGSSDNRYVITVATMPKLDLHTLYDAQTAVLTASGSHILCYRVQTKNHVLEMRSMPEFRLLRNVSLPANFYPSHNYKNEQTWVGIHSTGTPGANAVSIWDSANGTLTDLTAPGGHALMPTLHPQRNDTFFFLRRVTEKSLLEDLADSEDRIRALQIPRAELVLYHDGQETVLLSGVSMATRQTAWSSSGRRIAVCRPDLTRETGSSRLAEQLTIVTIDELPE